MAAVHTGHRLLSRPQRVHLLGFESDTYRMQQCGWDLSVDQLNYGMTLQVVARHRDAQLIVVSQPVAFAPVQHYTYGHDMETIDVIRFVGIARAVETLRANINLSRFEPIDATPQLIELDRERIAAGDTHRIFAPAQRRTEEIIVEPATVASLLEEIKKLQLPEQDAIRQRNRAREGFDVRPRQTLHAQIITLTR